MNAIDQCEFENYTDENGNPAGGFVEQVAEGSKVLYIRWQGGPLGRGKERREPNGAFVETVIAAALQRLRFYQEVAGGKFSCRDNALAITRLEEALFWLRNRTEDREARRVEGTHAP